MTELPCQNLPEVLLSVEKIPIIEYAEAGSENIAKNIAKYLPQCRTMILSRHGAVSWGESIIEAYNNMERIEHAALILKESLNIGVMLKG
jgi:L-fuculose-phosphate aldolase